MIRLIKLDLITCWHMQFLQYTCSWCLSSLFNFFGFFGQFNGDEPPSMKTCFFRLLLSLRKDCGGHWAFHYTKDKLTMNKISAIFFLSFFFFE